MCLNHFLTKSTRERAWSIASANANGDGEAADEPEHRG
jgi:hypothetical protein